jgi:hypothetical protein
METKLTAVFAVIVVLLAADVAGSGFAGDPQCPAAG